MRTDSRTILTWLILIFGISAHAQDPYLQKGDERAEEQTMELVRAYQGELGMTVEQAAQFKIKATEFIIRADKIRDQELLVEEKLELLKILSKQETAEMGTILTLPQLRQYKKLKKGIQPIMVQVGTTNPE